MWRRRHRGIVLLLAAHIPALFLLGVFTNHGALHTAVDVTPVAVLAVVAALGTFSPTTRAVLATLGLVTCSALAVHFSNGTIEMHFHFFVVVGVISLYQDWTPFGAAIVFVVLHHGIMGVAAPRSVYDHQSAIDHPWLWAAIHGGFVLAASVAHVLAWRLNEEYALRDPLTKLPNRALVADRVAHALARQERSGGKVALLFVDLDGFKRVNDTLGHARGDELLAVVARRLVGVLRNADTAGRFGGDEFAIVLEGSDDFDPDLTAARVLDALRPPIELGGRDVFVTASIGVSVANDTTTAEDLLRNADLAMYVAKALGRNRYERFDDSMRKQALDGVELADDLRRALDRGDLNVEYQPIVQLQSGRVLGIEALARWRHPTRGNVGPDVFIPVAERTDLMGRLGLFVLERACRTAHDLHRSHPDLDLSVNVSPSQLCDDAFPVAVGRVLAETQLNPRRLILEITEGMLIDDVEVVQTQLSRLRELGVRIAIDDFGTGYSSLGYLRNFSIDVLKIDRTFIQTLPGAGAELAQTILRLGEILNLDVVAEGIETPAQLAQLSALGCVHGQGFLFARPLDANAIAALVHTGGCVTVPLLSA